MLKRIDLTRDYQKHKEEKKVYQKIYYQKKKGEMRSAK